MISYDMRRFRYIRLPTRTIEKRFPKEQEVEVRIDADLLEDGEHGDRVHGGDEGGEGEDLDEREVVVAGLRARDVPHGAAVEDEVEQEADEEEVEQGSLVGGGEVK